MNPTLGVKSISGIIPAVLRPNDLSILIHWIDRSTPEVTGLRVLGSMVLSTMVLCLLNLGGPTSWPLCVVSSYTVPALLASWGTAVCRFGLVKSPAAGTTDQVGPKAR